MEPRFSIPGEMESEKVLVTPAITREQAQATFAEWYRKHRAVRVMTFGSGKRAELKLVYIPFRLYKLAISINFFKGLLEDEPPEESIPYEEWVTERASRYVSAHDASKVKLDIDAVRDSLEQIEVGDTLVAPNIKEAETRAWAIHSIETEIEQEETHDLTEQDEHYARKSVEISVAEQMIVYVPFWSWDKNAGLSTLESFAGPLLDFNVRGDTGAMVADNARQIAGTWLLSYALVFGGLTLIVLLMLLASMAPPQG